MKNEKEEEIKYFSIFTGVGGFELGFENAGSESHIQGGQNENTSIPQSLFSKRNKSSSSKFSCVGFSEIDKFASELLSKRFPTTKNYGDATKINSNELPDFNLLVGGFPCQAFSIAGKRKGFEDTRGTLFYEIVRILKVKRPNYILLENVKGLLSHDNGRTFAIILTSLSELGYVIQWMVLNSKFFGVPQNRERVFIIGSLRGKCRSEILPFGESNESFVEKSERKLSSTITSSYWKGLSGGRQGLIQLQKGNQGNRIYSTDGTSTTIAGQAGGQGAKTGLYAVLTPDRENKRQNGRRFKEEGEPSFTLTKQDIHGVSDGIKIRRLTPIECERLQGFPDNWTKGFSDTQRYKMMGNAVTVNVIKAIIGKMFK